MSTTSKPKKEREVKNDYERQIERYKYYLRRTLERNLYIFHMTSLRLLNVT